MILTKYTFSYTGNVQTWSVPYTGYYKLEVWGAQGGSRNNNGAEGGYSKGRIYLTKGENIYIYVGACPNYNTIWNGGGNSSYSGGDASDIRIGGKDLTNRIIVAGGGGGTGLGPNSSWNYIGGAGGGLTGGNGTGPSYYIGYGGTQTSGGARGSTIENNWYNESGSFGQGGNCSANSSGGAGGGGWYGGGAGECGEYNDAGGGGGSSYIGGVIDGSTTAGVRIGNGQIIISYYNRNTIAIEKDNKYYIPDKDHFNICTKSFKEVTFDELINLCQDYEYTYDITSLNSPFVYNGDTFLPSDIVNFNEYKLCIISDNNLNQVDLNYTPSSVALSKTNIKIKNKYTPFIDSLLNPYIDITGVNNSDIIYSIKYDFGADVIDVDANLIDTEILKDNFYLCFKFKEPTVLLLSVALYEINNVEYTKIKDDDIKVDNDYITTSITFEKSYPQILINRITKQHFWYLSSTLEIF